MTKYLFFDYDGTLCSEKTHTISQSTYEEFRRLRDMGHKLFLNSGRTKGMLEPLTYTLPFDGMVLSCGVQIILDGTQVFVTEMDHVDELIGFIESKHLSAIFADEQNLYCSQLTYPRLVEEKERHMSLDVPCFDMEKGLRVLRCAIYLENDELASLCQSQLPYYEYIDRGNHFYELIPKGHSKATGIHKVLDYYGASSDDCFVFGDSTNDLPVFEAFENSVLLDGEAPELKPLVKYTTECVEEDGLAHILRKLFWEERL